MFIQQCNHTNLETPLQLPYFYCSLCRTNYKYLQHHLFQIHQSACFLLHYLTHLDSFDLYFMTYSSQACNSSFVGYNCIYGNSHCRSYSTDHFYLLLAIQSERSETLILSFRILLTMNWTSLLLQPPPCSPACIFYSFCLCSLHLYWLIILQTT